MDWRTERINVRALGKPKYEIDRRHFAFKCDKEFILYKATEFLKQHGLNPFNFLNDGTDQPMVFAWIPAIAIYFDDPDGHHLEFISVLEGKGKPENGIITYERWLELEKMTNKKRHTTMAISNCLFSLTSENPLGF